MGDRRRNSETESQRKRSIGANEPYPQPKRRMLSITDVPKFQKRKEGEY